MPGFGYAGDFYLGGELLPEKGPELPLAHALSHSHASLTFTGGKPPPPPIIRWPSHLEVEPDPLMITVLTDSLTPQVETNTLVANVTRPSTKVTVIDYG